MNKKHAFIFILALIIFDLLPTPVLCQVNDKNQVKKSKAEKETEELLSYEKTCQLVDSRQFVFKAEYNQRSDEVFVVVDSLYAMVQNGNRNNQDGQVTHCKVTKNAKRKTVSITILIHGTMSTADVFIFMGPSGQGTASVKSVFPGCFSFDGFLVDFENARIYEGKSHFVR